MKFYEVTAAIIINKDEILCMQRNKSKFDYISYKFEFPGGKLEENEALEDGLKRELKEELELDVRVLKENYFMTVEYTYPDFSIKMHSYICNVDNRDFVMKEHIGYKWMKKENLMQLDWAPADLPIVRKLMNI